MNRREAAAERAQVVRRARLLAVLGAIGVGYALHRDMAGVIIGGGLMALWFAIECSHLYLLWLEDRINEEEEES